MQVCNRFLAQNCKKTCKNVENIYIFILSSKGDSRLTN